MFIYFWGNDLSNATIVDFDVCILQMQIDDLKVHKREKFFGSDFELFTILQLVKLVEAS